MGLAHSSRTLVGLLLRALVGLLLLWPMAGRASAVVVPRAPQSLEAMEQALARIADDDGPELWTHGASDAQAIAEAWASLRDSDEGQHHSPNLVWRLDSVCEYLPEAVERRDALRSRAAAVVGLHLLVPLRGYYRTEGDVTLWRLRAELREISLYAQAGDLPRAERARGRATHLWKRIRREVEERARDRRPRFAQVGSYFDFCFHELAVASSERDGARLHRAARSALDLTELARTVLEDRR